MFVSRYKVKDSTPNRELRLGTSFFRDYDFLVQQDIVTGFLIAGAPTVNVKYMRIACENETAWF